MKISVFGELCIVQSRHDGVLDDRQIAAGAHGAQVVFRRRNKIVDVGMQVFSRMLGGGANSPLVGGDAFSDLSEIAVAHMELGNATNPSPPADGDTAGVSAILYVPTLVVTYPSTTSVRFSGVIPSTEANGAAISEEALKLANGKLFAKIAISPAHTKLPGTALQINHTINFARA